MPDSLPPIEVDVATAHALLEANEATLIDVREPDEHAICQIKGSRFLPMREIPGALASLPRDRKLLVLCHHGGRSAHVTQYLRAHGFDRAINVRGGIDAWATDLDPSLVRY
ncbi:MAG TPA: rhodanese-like domain-containing protein [Opitutaceae bacterium]|nr:rhodanese-like domain-containing protein [Opitutaceae bacterium]